MKSFALHILKVAVAVLFTVQSMHGSEVFKKDSLTISFPAGWVEIPREILDATEKGLSGEMVGASSPHYDYGFQLESEQGWLKYPYILIQVNDKGRMPESEIEKLEGYKVQGDLDREKEKYKNVLSDVKVGELHYDRMSKVIWMRMESSAINVGKIASVSGMIPTERGMVMVHCYALDKEFPRYEAAFQKVVKSVVIRPDLVYKPRWSDSLPGGFDWGQVFEKALLGGIIGGIVGLILIFTKKKVK